VLSHLPVSERLVWHGICRSGRGCRAQIAWCTVDAFVVVIAKPRGVGMKLGKLWIAMVIVLTLGGNLRSAPVTLQITGAVTNVPSGLSSQFTAGQLISGSYTFETTTADNQNSPSLGGYVGAISAFEVTVGAYSVSSILQGDIQIENGIPDTYIATTFTQGNSVNGASPLLQAIQLNDPTGTAFSSDALPLVVNVNQFSGRDFTLDFTNGDRLLGRVDAIFVPEPATWGWIVLFLGLGRPRKC
jgi:hypothetical protein